MNSKQWWLMKSKTFSEQQTKYLSNWKGLNMTTMFSYIFPNPCWENIKQNRKKCFPWCVSRHPEKRCHKKWYKRLVGTSVPDATAVPVNSSGLNDVRRVFASSGNRRPVGDDVQQAMTSSGRRRPAGNNFRWVTKTVFLSEVFTGNKNRNKRVLKRWRHSKAIFLRCRTFYGNKHSMLPS